MRLDRAYVMNFLVQDTNGPPGFYQGFSNIIILVEKGGKV